MIATIEDAIKWLDTYSEFKKSVVEKVTSPDSEIDMISKIHTSRFPEDKDDYDYDSSPAAWEHYFRFYPVKNFGVVVNDDEIEESYSFERLRYKTSSGVTRLYMQTQSCVDKKSQTVCNCLPRIGGETDFNFKDTASVYFKKLLGDDVGASNLLCRCQKMFHSLLNFSLMQAMGNLQCIKGARRLDEFVCLLEEYFAEKEEQKRFEKLKSYNKCRNSANTKELCKYLNQFDGLYDYCAKIYFLPTGGYPTDVNVECPIELYESNKVLIDGLCKHGKIELDSSENVINYMLLAVNFWQAKEKYFNLATEQNKENI